MLSKILPIAVFVVLAQNAFAVDLAQYFNFDGQLLNDSTSAPLTGPASMTFRLYDPSGTCLLYEETQPSVALDSLGAFSVKIGPGGGGTRNTSADGALLWKTIFQNYAQVRGLDATYCPGGYTPAAGDGRKLRVLVNGTALSPDYALAATPFATVAETLQGKTPNDFLSSSGNSSLSGYLKFNSQSELRFSDSATNYVGFRAPASLSTNRIWTLPASDGSAGQCLQTDGAGALSWVTPGGGGGSLTSINGLTSDAQTFANGTTGISPGWSSSGAIHTLNIPMASSTGVTAGLLSKSDYDTFNNKLSSTGASMTGNLSTSGSVLSGSGSASVPGLQVGSAANGLYAPLSDTVAFSTAGVERLRIDSAGNVGIGTTAPSAPLEVAGQVKITGGTPGAGKVLTSDAAGLASWQTPPVPLAGATGATYVTLGSSANGTGTGHVAVGTQAGFNYAGTSSTLIGYQAAGAGGSGTNNTVVGASALSGAAVSGSNNTVVGASATLGTSVANAVVLGKGAQVSGSGGVAIGAGAVAGANTVVIGVNNGTFQERLRIDGSGNVGIGTASPTALLHVNGAVKLGTGASSEIRLGGAQASPFGFVASAIVANDAGGFMLGSSLSPGFSIQGSYTVGPFSSVGPGDNVICSPNAGSGGINGKLTWSCYALGGGTIYINLNCASGGDCPLPTDWRVTVIKW